MAILILKNREVKEYKLPSQEKEESLYKLWNKIYNKKIKINRKDGKVEYIRLVDIEDCLIGDREIKYKNGNIFNIIFEQFNFLFKNIFKKG